MTENKEREVLELMNMLREDPVLFCRLFFGTEPYKYQQELLRTRAKRITAVWGRQCLAEKTLVFNKDGSVSKIEEIGFKTGVKPCYRLRTNHGKEIVASEEHLFKIDEGFKKLVDLKVGEYIHVCEDYDIFPTGKNTFNDEQIITLAYLAGDGYFGDSLKFTNTNPKLIEEFCQCIEHEFEINPKLYKKGNGWDVLATTPSHATGSNPLINFINNIEWDGRFPQINFTRPHAKLFINRLWACDGYITKSYRNRKGRIEEKVEIGLGKNDERLIRNIQMLLLKFGIHSNIRKEHNMFRLRISDWISIERFIDNFCPIYGKEGDHKSIKIPKHNIGWRLRNKEKVKSIKYIGMLPTWDREVLPEHSHIANGFKVHNSGKTTCIAWKVIHYAYTNDHVNVLIVSKGLRQSMIMYGVISMTILDNPLLRKSVERYTRTEINLKNGSKIVALPCSSDGANLRGYTAHIVVMDEAAFMSETVITQVIFPMLATTSGTAIMLSTPWGRNHIFYRSFVDPAFWVQRVRSRDCPKITDEFLEEQHRLIGDLRFRIEYEAEFLEDATALFTQDMIRGAIEIWDDEHDTLMSDKDIDNIGQPLIGTYVLGADLGKRLDNSVIIILKLETKKLLSQEYGRPINRKVWRLIYKKQFPLRTPLMHVANFIKYLATKIPFTTGCVDQTGLGEAVVEELQMDLPWIEGVPLYGAQRKQDVAMFAYTRLERQELCLPLDRELINQMNEQCYGYSAVKEKIITEEKGVMVFYHPEGRHDDQLWALMLGIYATRDKPESGIVL